MQNVPYASAVRSIMYAVRCTRPNVAFTQNITTHFQQNPGELNWTAMKTILKYLRNIKDMNLDMVSILNRGAMDWKAPSTVLLQYQLHKLNNIAASEAAMEVV
ncbi:hypothetical protein Tco_0517276 [Tanacetum coccineum]